MRNDEHAEVAEALIAGKNAFYAQVQNAHEQGLPIQRIIGLIGFGNTSYIFGRDAVEPFGDNRPERREPKPTPAPRIPGASPMMMARRNT